MVPLMPFVRPQCNRSDVAHSREVPMNMPNQAPVQRGAAAPVPAVDVRAKAMDVLASRRTTSSQLLWAIYLSTMVGAAGGWLMFPDHIAVGPIATIGWMLAIILVQQCVQLRRDVNALIDLANLSGPSGS